MTNQKGRNMMPKEKDFIEKTLEEMNEIERLKYETAVELGLFVDGSHCQQVRQGDLAGS